MAISLHAHQFRYPEFLRAHREQGILAIYVVVLAIAVIAMLVAWVGLIVQSAPASEFGPAAAISAAGG